MEQSYMPKSKDFLSFGNSLLAKILQTTIASCYPSRGLAKHTSKGPNSRLQLLVLNALL
jgi:hypothetical protein